MCVVESECRDSADDMAATEISKLVEDRMRKWPMQAGRLKQIEKILGRAIPASEEDSLNSFLDFAEEDLAELRKIASYHGLLALEYALQRKGIDPIRFDSCPVRVDSVWRRSDAVSVFGAALGR